MVEKMKLNEKRRVIYKDLFYTIDYERKHTHGLNFRCYNTIDVYANEEFLPDDLVLEGNVKWDGCANWSALILHTCTREMVVDIGTLMLRIWDYTKENLETFDNES